MAPAIVGESLKGAELLSEIMQNYFNFSCNPPPNSHRTDIIQAIKFENRQKVFYLLFIFLVFHYFDNVILLKI
jgi:cystathionine beta-lyase family protein involved in aluminum resistance